MSTATLTDAVRAYLEEPHFAVLATTNANGTIQQTVMWYALRGDTIMMNTLGGRVKDNNLRRNPQASVCVANGYQFVTINGTISFDEDFERGRDDIYALARRYSPDGAPPSFPTEGRVTLSLSIDSVITHGFDGEH